MYEKQPAPFIFRYKYIINITRENNNKLCLNMKITLLYGSFVLLKIYFMLYLYKAYIFEAQLTFN